MPNALFVEIEARQSTTEEIRDFLEQALAKAQGEPDTRDWYAIRFDESHFGIFDTFDGAMGRIKHIAGAIGRGLVIKTVTSLHGMPHVSMSEIVAAIVPDPNAVPTVGTYVEIETRLGAGRDFGEALVKARENAASEADTLAWYALRTAKNGYAVFDTFPHEEARAAHLHGIAHNGVMEAINRFVDTPVVFRRFDIIASKQSGWIGISSAEQQVHSEQPVRVGPKTA
ncbi:hypothetical protein NFI95_07475 [Acetobacteraceae bacterium KSS8]|uniref:ABM domain-containing protein n=1 Tax=Endosaccharibacter trunci TaxID=2812733 RepID=A0ABT1W6A6_9PROT|nr:hypothetical protein [Acetobacteraceae bacterium KSS8]